MVMVCETLVEHTSLWNKKTKYQIWNHLWTYLHIYNKNKQDLSKKKYIKKTKKQGKSNVCIYNMINE